MTIRIYTTRTKTHFIRAEEAINETMKPLPYASENWAYPVRHFGTPHDKYYAEVWVNGMDWQNNYWIIETSNWENPKVYPLIIFKNTELQDKFNQYDFHQLLDAIFWYRRDKLWIKQDDDGIYNDTVYPYLKTSHSKESEGGFMEAVVFSHASQEPIEFLINKDFLPKRVLSLV